MVQIEDVISNLTTIRDYIRWGASQFKQENLFFGHGTDNPLEDAAALVLHVLHQPYDLPFDYLGSVLVRDERVEVVKAIERRILERLPTAYLTHEAIFAGHSFFVDQRVLIPRSPVAELIEQQFSPWKEAGSVNRILDLCTGSGCIAIACAYAFPEATVDAVDISREALAVAKININKHNLTQQVFPIESDLFSNLGGVRYDIILTNPPYVSRAEWQNLPAEYHAEPKIGFDGGETGLDSVKEILKHALEYLTDDGILIVEVGSSAEALQNAYPKVPFCWLEFERGGEGVFLLKADQLKEWQNTFDLNLD